MICLSTSLSFVWASKSDLNCEDDDNATLDDQVTTDFIFPLAQCKVSGISNNATLD